MHTPKHNLRHSARFFAALTTLILLPTQLTLTAAAQAPTPPQAPAPAPLPPAPTLIASAHKIFLQNAGAAPNFPIDQAHAYESIYAALQSWGRYQLVPSAAEADLVFALHDVAPITNVVGNDAGTYTLHTPAFQLNILDAHTGVNIWTITSPVMLEGRGKTYERWVNVSITNLISRIKVLSGATLNARESDNLTTYPRSYHGAGGWWVFGGTVALAAGGGLLLHYLSDKTLADMKASQDKFCEENNIPLSECAGG